jgi:hypothetical protein
LFVTRGCDTIRTCKAVRLAQVQAGFRRQSDCASNADRGGPAPQPLAGPGRVRAGGCSSAASRSIRGGRRTRAPASCLAHSLSRRRRHPGRFILRCGERRNRIPPIVWAHSLAARPGVPWPVHPPFLRAHEALTSEDIRVWSAPSVVVLRPKGIPLPTLTIVSRSAHGSTRYCIPGHMCPVLGCPVTDVNAALRARGGVKSTLGFHARPGRSWLPAPAGPRSSC